MTVNRRIVHTVFLLLLPIIVAWFGLSVFAAAVLVIVLLAWRWFIVMSGVASPQKRPALILETISASHFVEKVRWCLDRLGVDYTEQQCGGVIGVFFTGRTVPVLKMRTGIVRSSIGNSPEILRYLWGNHAATEPGRAAFLKPTAPRLALEKRIDRYGVDLQVWVYYHILQKRELTLRAWGVDNPLVPWWQRALLRPLFPLLSLFVRRAFSIDAAHFATAVQHVDEMLGDIDARLADGRTSILSGEEPDYVDITFAALSGLWLQPQGYGGDKAEAYRIADDRIPGAMRDDIERWSEDYPKATAFIEHLYATERLPSTNVTNAGQSKDP